MSPPRVIAAALAVLLARAAAGEELIRVRVSAEPEEIRELRLEDYVAGVVGGEMPARFPRAALEAQAVAARSYALTRKVEAQAANRRWDIATGVLAQVFAHAHPAARAAAEATAGEVLVHGMEPVEAYFHAVCGGHTEAGLPALNRDLPYLASVECRRCERAPRARWRVNVPAAELGRAAGLGRASALRVTSRSPSGRAERVEVSAGRRTATLSAADLRQRLGYLRLPSLDFEAAPARGGFELRGRGLGHGAGMCQWGAAGMAREGAGYREILLHYYPGTEVKRLY